MTSTNSSLFSTKSYSCNGNEVRQEDDLSYIGEQLVTAVIQIALF